MKRSVTALLASCLLPLTLLVPPSTPSAAGAPAETCTTFEFIGARGSGQLPQERTESDGSYGERERFGMGGELFEVFEGVRRAVEAAGQTITPHGLRSTNR